jgi:hypothetical protein
MNAPDCLKCHTSDNMVEEASGVTYTTWCCLQGNTSRSQKNLLGKVLPFAELAAAVIVGSPIDFPSGGSSL